MVGGILWFGTDDAATSYLTPIYTNVTEVPECFAEGNGNMITYSATSAFWMCNRVANACYRMYDVMAPIVKAKIDEFENAQLAAIPEIDRKAVELYETAMAATRKEVRKNGDRFSDVKKYLTEYSVSTAQGIFNDWTELEVLLLLKYIDGNVKGQNPDGSFITNGYTDHIPGDITNPGYTEKWRQAVAEDNGAVLEVK